MAERRGRGEQRGGRGRGSGAAGDGRRAGRKGRPRGRRSQRMVWKEALGRRSKLSPNCSGCSSLSSNEFAEPFMAPLLARPVPSLSSVRCRPASSRKFLAFSSGNPLRAGGGYGGARRGPGAGLGLLPRGGSPERWESGAPRPRQGRTGQGRRGFPFLSFPSPSECPSPGHAGAGAARGKLVPTEGTQRCYMFVVLALD